MRWLLFLSRVAFICNLLFVVSAVLQWKPFIANEGIVSTIVISGYFLAVFVFSPLVNVLYVVQAFIRKNGFGVVPRWLVLSNVFFFLIQIVFITLYLNDSVYY
jgi:hypothetical protein